jgi:FAD binding domain/Berberine and berberine like
MKRREFIGTGLALAAAWPLKGWSAVLKDVGDVAAKMLDGGDVNLPGKAVADLAAGLSGDLLLQGNPAYDARRRIWNGMFDKHPALIACCNGAADVRRAVDFARENRLLTAVRSGGHSVSGKSTCEGGFVIDLQAMRGVRVEPEMARAFVESGSMLGQLDYESAAFGFATTAGSVSHTGVAGLTLGGGFGRLGRRFGLACDNALAFDIVTADGHFMRVTDEENADLMWGLRGGGGNFGIVTAIEYRLHRMDPVVLAGNLAWPIAKARDVLRFHRDHITGWPRELYAEPALVPGKDGPMISMELCWSGDRAQGEALIKPIRAFASPLADDVAPMRYVDLQRGADGFLAFGKSYYMKGGFVDQLTDDAIDVVLDAYQQHASGDVLFFEPCDGAYLDVAPTATAFPNRGPNCQLGLIAVMEGDSTEAGIEKVRAAWKEIAPLTHGFYTNLTDVDQTLAGYRDNYGANLEQLMALKAKYDPMNLFRLNANVPPKA